MPITLKKATRTAKHIRFALMGPSGSGKTYTGLRLCRDLAGPTGRVIVIDTEHGSASMYAGMPDVAGEFDVIELDSFSPENYKRALEICANEGAAAVLIDSLSHAWAGKDGLLEFVDHEATKSGRGDSFGAWRKATPKHNELVESILSTPFHVVVTMRVKTEYVVEKNDKGKNSPRKVGLQPVQRDGLEYEFDCVADMDTDHNLIVGKTRIDLLDGKVFNKPAGQIVALINQWMGGSAPAQAPAPTPRPAAPAAAPAAKPITALESDPAVIAAFEQAGTAPAKRAALLKSARDGKWTADTLIGAITGASRPAPRPAPAAPAAPTPATPAYDDDQDF